MVTYIELKNMAEKELDVEFNKSKLELLKLRLAVASRQSKETSKIKALRKYIARIKVVRRFMKTERAKENPKSAVTK